MLESLMALAAAILGIALSLSIIAILIARALNLPELEKIGKKELVEVITNALILTAIFSLLVLGQNAMLELFKMVTNYLARLEGYSVDLSNVTSLSHIMFIYVNSTLSCLLSIIKLIYRYQFYTGTIATFSVDTAMGNGGKIAGLFSGNITSFLLEVSTVLYVGYLIFYYTVALLEYAIPVYIFPLGVLLRMFPPTRGAGAYLLAFSVMFGVFLPLFFIGTTIYYQSMIKEIGVLNGGTIGGTITWSTNCGVSTAVGIGNEEQLACSLSKLTGDIPSLVSKGIAITSGVDLNEWYNKILYGIAFISMKICLVPLVVLAMTLTGTLALSQLLGANIPEVGRGLAKLI